jgi:hypothetical protein
MYANWIVLFLLMEKPVVVCILHSFYLLKGLFTQTVISVSLRVARCRTTQLHRYNSSYVTDPKRHRAARSNTKITVRVNRS